MNFDFDSHSRLWKVEVLDKAEQVDPLEDYIWRGVAVGWAIGKGMDIGQAQEFVNHLDILNLL